MSNCVCLFQNKIFRKGVNYIMLGPALTGLSSFLDISVLLYLILGSMLGMFFGILPGLGGATALALLLPLTFGMDTTSAVVLLISTTAATAYGGSITAILINTPGTSQNIATTFDGYPLAKQGRAGVALGASATASALGGIFGCLVLMALIPLARNIVLLFSYPDYFLLAILGLSVIAVVSQGSVLKGLIAAGIGLLISFIGYDQTGFARYDFNNPYLWSGISLVPVVIGVFAIVESIELFLKGGTISSTYTKVNQTSDIKNGILSVFKNFGLFLRSSVIGTIIGIIPGVGGTVANFVSYMQAKQTSKNNELFGKGDIRGVIAPEAANNAKDGGSLIPTVAFGVPGSAEMAILLGALILHGLEPGPKLLIQDADVLFTLIFGLVIATIFVSVIGLIFARQFAKLTSIPTKILAPCIFIVSAMGALAVNGYFGDLIIAIIFGVLGFYMKKFGYSRIALVIALTLGSMAENSFFQTYKALGFTSFVTRPFSLILIIIILSVLIFPLFQKARKRKEGGDFAAKG